MASRFLYSIVLLAALCLAFPVETTHAAGPVQNQPAEDDQVPDASNFNLPLKTTDFSQIWTDHRYREGYRVQHNALTGHWRLVDGDNYRRAWGTKSQCVEALDERRPPQPEQPARHRIILLHGLMRTCSCMRPLEKQLADKGMTDVIRFSYASTRQPIGGHAAALREMLENLPTNDSFSFVGHSMGNIVVRHAIGDLQAENDPKAILPRCRSMVMLGPPNQGAMIAERLAPTKVFGWVTGQGGLELGTLWQELEPKLAVPPFPFHIIAGDIKTPVSNPLVDGAGDFIVSLEEAKLDGAASFRTVPILHSFLMDNQEVMDSTVELLGASAGVHQK